jgi:GntR family transcriptional regulator
MVVADGPAYERMAAQLRTAILDGQVTGRLPSLEALSARYGVTRDVARRAVEILRGEGLVVTHQGRGTYVRVFSRIVRRSPGRLARERWGAGHDIQDADTGTRPRTADVVVGEVPAPGYVATALGVPVGQPVLARARRFLVDRRPVQLATSYLPLDVVGDTRIAYTDTGPGGIYARLAELGYGPVAFTERVTARAPRPDEVDRLELGTAVGALVFEVTRSASTGTGRCVEVNRMILDATAYELVYDFDAG